MGKVRITGGSGDFETIPEGIYTLQIIKVEDAFWTYKGQDKEGFNFTFAILDDEELPESGESTRGRYLWWRVSNSINKRSHLYKLACAALGRDLTAEETDTSEDNDELLSPEDDLVGLQLTGIVKHNEDSDGRLWANIDSVTKVKEELEPLEVKTSDEDEVKTTKTTPLEEVMEEEDDDEDLDDVLENPVLDEIMEGFADEEDEDEDEEDEEEDDDEEEELDEEEAEEAARKAALRLKKIKEAKKAKKSKKPASKKSKSVKTKKTKK